MEIRYVDFNFDQVSFRTSCNGSMRRDLTSLLKRGTVSRSKG